MPVVEILPHLVEIRRFFPVKTMAVTKHIVPERARFFLARLKEKASFLQ